MNKFYEALSEVIAELIVENKYNPNQPRVPKGNPNGGQFAKQNGGNTARTLPKLRDYNQYLNRHKQLKLVDKYPPVFKGQTEEDIAKFLGIKGKEPAIFQTPVETVMIYRSNFKHIKHETDKTRIRGLIRAIETLKNPNIIIRDKKENYYIKFFTKGQKDKIHMHIIRTTKKGGFYKSNFPISKNRFENMKGQIIYDLSSRRGK